jgi:cytochrome c oxidase subunit 2
MKSLAAVSLVCGFSTAARAEEHSFASILRPLATPARAEYELTLLVAAVCLGLFLVVGGLLAYAVYRFRERGPITHDEPPQLYGSNQVEIAWTVIPILIVFVLTMATGRVTSAIQDRQPAKSELQVNVVGHQWWWEYSYPDLKITTANELHAPVGAATFLHLDSTDVVHSFWVPQLSGKTDVIPNRANRMWIDPKETGVYYGNCAEYCGVQHAHMLIRVVVESKDDFDKWVAAQRKPAPMTDSPGEKTFLSLACVECHTVRGVPASGDQGPDLTHVMSRATIAAGQIANNKTNLRAWLTDPQAIKAGNYMPNLDLSSPQLDQLVDYLLTLK